MHLDSTVVAAFIAAAVAALGYTANQFAQRRERRSRAYADALRAVRTVQELPYLVWRRADSNPETVEALGRLQSQALSEIRFYDMWLRIETRWVGEIFGLLQMKARGQSRRNRRRAWQESLLDSGLPLEADTPPFTYDIRREMTLCIDAMTASAAWWGVLVRWRLKRRFRDLAKANHLLVPGPDPVMTRLPDGDPLAARVAPAASPPATKPAEDPDPKTDQPGSAASPSE
jgi:hypothetical protein